MFLPPGPLSLDIAARYLQRAIGGTRDEATAMLVAAYWRGRLEAAAGSPDRLTLLRVLYWANGRTPRLLFLPPGDEVPREHSSQPHCDGGITIRYDLRLRLRVQDRDTAKWTEAGCKQAFEALAQECDRLTLPGYLTEGWTVPHFRRIRATGEAVRRLWEPGAPGRSTGIRAKRGRPKHLLEMAKGALLELRKIGKLPMRPKERDEAVIRVLRDQGKLGHNKTISRDTIARAMREIPPQN